MTGLGMAEIQHEGTTINVELRSVNNRFLELMCRMPPFLSRYEREVKDIIKSQITRGKLYVSISVQGETNNVLDIGVDLKKAQSIRNVLNELRKVTGVNEELRLEHFLQFSEVFQSIKESETSEKIWEKVRDVLTRALEDLKQMRIQEGKALEKDIMKRIRCLGKNITAIQKIAKKNLSESYKKMVERIEKLMGNRELDKERLHTEIVLMADKMDVTEECVRLQSHNQVFLRTLKQEVVVGKRLNFLLQEMNRETNTISSKASNAEISHLVVEMKEEIEKLREQVQNLE